MHISTPILLLLAAASPVFGAGAFDKTCKYQGTRSETNDPRFLKYKCDRAGKNGPVCAQVDLTHCIISVYGMLTPKLLDGFNGDYHDYPRGCANCRLDEKKSDVSCLCIGKHGQERQSTVHLGQWFANRDGQIVGVENLHSSCRSKKVSC